MITFRKARKRDAEALAGASKRAFDHDIHFGAPGPGGPPGYDSPRWQAMVMGHADYWAIIDTPDETGKSARPKVIGGMIVFRKGPGHYELGRIFLVPERQNSGIGAQAFAFLDDEYFLARRWTLGTPRWNKRTRHFYAKMGFAEIGTDEHGGVLFERILPVPRPPGDSE